MLVKEFISDNSCLVSSNYNNLCAGIIWYPPLYYINLKVIIFKKYSFQSLSHVTSYIALKSHTSQGFLILFFAL